MRSMTVLITGGAKGLGRLFAEALGRAGANLVVTGRDLAALEAAQRDLAEQGVPVAAIQADVLDRAAMAGAVDRAVSRFGGLDVLVNNAVLPGPVGPSWEVDLAAWSQTQQVNVVGALSAAQAALAVMVPAGRGRIINLVSPAGLTRWPYATAYSVSKAALIKLSENLAAELSRSGVTVLSYNPGIVDAGLTRAGLAFEGGDDPWLDKIAAWGRRVRDEGGFTPLDTSVEMLVRLARGDADALSGLTVNALDDLDALVARAAPQGDRNSSGSPTVRDASPEHIQPSHRG
jgi:NAD(P)-dependent dehydrogenase (short-subunit alcohol dehydrogenase family)